MSPAIGPGDVLSGATVVAASALDPGALARLVELDADGRGLFVRRVLQTFVTSAAKQRALFDAARRAGALDNVAIVAHTLKSSSAVVGALRLHAVCIALDTAIREKRFAALPEAMAAFEPALDEALRLIDAWLRDTP